jgi:glutathione peroxidase
MPDSIFKISIDTLSGKPLVWSDFMNKKIMIVNVASECGFTPQYAQLQELYEANSDKLVILGCPCNDFGGQEPGESSQIEQFCQVNYGVTFPLTEKIKITQNPHSLYVWLTQKEKNQKGDFTVHWNFHKFLIDDDGSLYKSLPSTSDPFCDDILHWLR